MSGAFAAVLLQMETMGVAKKKLAQVQQLIPQVQLTQRRHRKMR